MNRTLKLGTAYHGNRILRHVEEDMTDIVKHHMNTVVHMYTHNDMERHPKVMKDIFALSEDLGLEVWVDNWGIDCGPGDKSHFTAFHPEAKMVFKDGTPAPLKPCFNHPAFRSFTKEWVDAVRDAGGKTLFWDEPVFATSQEHGDACFCPVCRKLFEEQYNHSMTDATETEIHDFRIWSCTDYFRFATDYAHQFGMTNTGCVIVSSKPGFGTDLSEALMKLPNFDNVGCDPYWATTKNPDITAKELYDKVYAKAKRLIDSDNALGKDHNLWLQCHAIPKGREEEQWIAANAMYDAGARTILTWSFRGGEPNDYRCDCCEMAWDIAGQIMAELQRRYFNDMVEEIRKSNLVKES